MKLHVLRLMPNDDLRQALNREAGQRGIAAGFILSTVGSLSRACLRFADEGIDRLIGGPLEILSLSGTLSPDGCHVHIAVADARGTVTGGHVLEGCIVRTTAEIVIGEAPGVEFSREQDVRTGYRELVIKPAPLPS